MSRKGELKKEIGDCEREILAYEQKRERSQTAIIRAFLSGTKPSKEDEQYFNLFTNLIDQAREKLRGLYAELEALNKK